MNILELTRPSCKHILINCLNRMNLSSVFRTCLTCKRLGSYIVELKHCQLAPDHSNEYIDDEILTKMFHHLVMCRKLKSVEIKRCLAHLEEFDFPQRLPWVQSLVIRSCSLENMNVERLVAPFPGISKLTLADVDMDDDALSIVTQICTKLEHLKIEFFWMEPNLLCPNFSSMPLRSLVITTKDGAPIPLNDASLSLIARNCPDLESIEIDRSSALYAPVVGDLVRLRSLILSCANLRRSEMPIITAKMPNLETLKLLDCTSLNNFRIASLPKLRVLDLTETPIGDSCFTAIMRAVPNVQEIILSGCLLLQSPAQLDVYESVRKLDLSVTKIANFGLVMFIRSFPNVTHFNLANCFLLRDFKLEGLNPKLVFLNLWGSSSVSTTHLKTITKRFPRCLVRVNPQDAAKRPKGERPTNLVEQMSPSMVARNSQMFSFVLPQPFKTLKEIQDEVEQQENDVIE